MRRNIINTNTNLMLVRSTMSSSYILSKSYIKSNNKSFNINNSFLIQKVRNMSSNVVDKQKVSNVNESNEILLYTGNSEMTIGFMFSMGVFNMAYWTYYITNCYLYKDVIIQGIDFGGDPRWGYAGAFGTGLIFYCNRTYAHNTVKRAYETSDGERLGFQMHNMLGQLGRKIEVNKNNARLANVNMTFATSLIPLRVEGIGPNVLLDQTGTYKEDKRLMDILEENRANTDYKGTTTAVDSKEKRNEWKSKSFTTSKNKRKQR